jgi:hypothetical protein
MDWLEDYDEERFIAGVYNYCDRWCERCRFSDRCYLYHQEQAMFEEHVRRGEDPDDPEVVMGDVAQSMEQAMGMLQRMAEEMGVDLNEVEDDRPPSGAPARPRRDHHEDPLYERMARWSERIGAILKMVSAEIPEQGQQMVKAFESGEIEDPDAAVETLSAVRDAYELLGRYRFFVAVKIARAISGWDEAEEEEEQFREDARQDSLGTAKLVHDCMGRAGQALWQIGEFHRPWLEMAMPLALEAESLRQAIDAAFPNHQAFRRPGFDDPESGTADERR